ncbi:penicillin acylase family protein [Catenovulum sediminis]|uniref:Penicillin acylase family protein n=1 Tax=Catenovulum sediminis TaxID=1740262 RepID=A0ABV1RMA2_9ALTE
MHFFTLVIQRHPLLARVCLFVLLPIVLLCFATLYVLDLSLAQNHQQIKVPELNAPVTIDYDHNAIPTISASEDLAVFYGMGFVHAQNRLWQMEMNRRTAAGRLSEILGRSTLESDKLMRVLGLYENAKKMWQQLPADDKKVLTAYVKGVNAGMAQLNVLPPEFLLYQHQPEKWTEVDSLSWMQLLSFQLSNSMLTDIQRAALIQAYGLEKTQALMPLDIDASAITQLATVQNMADLEPLIALAQNFQAQQKQFVGSNSWVVSGKHTKSGQPLLANDPHLAYSTPAIFYLAKLNGDKLAAEGASFPGLPFIVIGRNAQIAWGLTNMMADTQDIYVERVNPHNINQYLYDGKYLAMQLKTELIEVKSDFLKPAEPAVTINIRRTIHGPVISDLNRSENSFAYSLKWTGDEQNGGTFSSFLALNYAQNWTQFKQALSTFVAPVHNFVYADKQGNIGRYAPGLIPLRSENSGMLPKPGWLSDTNWQGWVEHAQLPQQYNPPSGMIVAANHNLLAEDYPFYLGNDWAPGYRAQRVQSLLQSLVQSGALAEPQSFKNIQQDITLPKAPAFLTVIRDLQAWLENHQAQTQNAENQQTEKYIQTLQFLANWQGEMSADSAQATIFSAWMAHFTRLLVEDDIQATADFINARNYLAQFKEQENLWLLQQVLSQGNTLWCDYQLTATTESCQQLLWIALQHAVDELEKSYSSDIENLQWRQVHHAHFPHFPMSDAKYLTRSRAKSDNLLAGLFHRQAQSKGSGYTINVAPVTLDETRRFAQLVGPVYRQVIELADNGQFWFTAIAGQSGNPLSQHYDDFTDAHQAGRYFTFSSGGRDRDKLPLMLLPELTVSQRASQWN